MLERYFETTFIIWDFIDGDMVRWQYLSATAKAGFLQTTWRALSVKLAPCLCNYESPRMEL